MNILWTGVPKLLSTYDRYILRSFIKTRATGVYSIVDEDDESARCKYSNAEIWILAACVGLHAHDQCRNGESTEGSETIWIDLAWSLLRTYGKGLLHDWQTAEWRTVGEYFRWFTPLVERRIQEYASALDADVARAASNPHFWSGEFKSRVLDNVFTREPMRDEKMYDLGAYEIASYLLNVAYPSILNLLSEPTLRRLTLGWVANKTDSFWATFEASD